MAALTSERAVLSSEIFCEADDDAVARAVNAFGPKLHVVVTLRPVAKILPSQWQELLGVKLDLTYDDWLNRVLADETDPQSQRFWLRHRHDALVARWAAAVGPENVTVIVLDPGNRAMLGATFEAMLGLAPRTLDVERERGDGDNRSFTHAEAEMVRQFNEYAKRPENAELLRTRGPTRLGFAARLRSRTPGPTEAPIATPWWALERAAAIGAQMADNLRASGVRIIGDLTELSSMGGPGGEPEGEVWLPPEVGADFAIAIHHARAVFERSAARETPAPNPLASASIRELSRELARRLVRRR